MLYKMYYLLIFGIDLFSNYLDMVLIGYYVFEFVLKVLNFSIYF